MRHLSDKPLEWRHESYPLTYWLSQCRKQPYTAKRRRGEKKKIYQWKTCICHHSRSCSTKNWVLADSARVGWLDRGFGYPRAAAPSMVFLPLPPPSVLWETCFFAPRPPFVFFTLCCRARSPLLNGRWNAQYLIPGGGCSEFDSSAKEHLSRGCSGTVKKYPHRLNDFFSRECDVKGVS